VWVCGASKRDDVGWRVVGRWRTILVPIVQRWLVFEVQAKVGGHPHATNSQPEHHTASPLAEGILRVAGP
jgi:hypothetical protein